MPSAKFASQLEASSYYHPNGGEAYAPLRQKIVETATAMGYDPATMCERGIVWSDDQDPFDHVANSAYPHFVSICNFRIFEGFEEYLGERYQDMFKGRGIGVMVKTFTLDIKRPVTYPDSLIIANRILEVLPDRYYGITSIWSLRQQTIVADLKGYVVFFDYTKGKPANLLEVKGVYAKLHAGLTSKMLKGNELAAKWELKHSKKFRAKI